MFFHLIILKSVAEETKQVYEYYEEISAGLGDRFLRELLEKYNDIKNHPHYYGFIDSKNIIRDVKLKNFPFLVIYEIEGDSIIIYSVHNINKHPDNKFRK